MRKRWLIFAIIFSISMLMISCDYTLEKYESKISEETSVVLEDFYDLKNNLHYCNQITSPEGLWVMGLAKNIVGTTEINIPDDFAGKRVVAIAENAFKGRTEIISVNFEKKSKDEAFTKIGNSAFEGCTNLKKINNLPNTITQIGQFAFKGCTSLTDCQIPESIEYIHMGAFSGDPLGGNLDLKQVKYVGSNAFSNALFQAVSIEWRKDFEIEKNALPLKNAAPGGAKAGITIKNMPEYTTPDVPALSDAWWKEYGFQPGWTDSTTKIKKG